MRPSSRIWPTMSRRPSSGPSSQVIASTRCFNDSLASSPSMPRTPHSHFSMSPPEPTSRRHSTCAVYRPGAISSRRRHRPIRSIVLMLTVQRCWDCPRECPSPRDHMTFRPADSAPAPRGPVKAPLSSARLSVARFSPTTHRSCPAANPPECGCARPIRPDTCTSCRRWSARRAWTGCSNWSLPGPKGWIDSSAKVRQVLRVSGRFRSCPGRANAHPSWIRGRAASSPDWSSARRAPTSSGQCAKQSPTRPAIVSTASDSTPSLPVAEAD